MYHQFIYFAVETCFHQMLLTLLSACAFSREALIIGLKPSGDRLMWSRWKWSSEGLPEQVP